MRTKSNKPSNRKCWEPSTFQCNVIILWPCNRSFLGTYNWWLWHRRRGVLDMWKLRKNRHLQKNHQSTNRTITLPKKNATTHSQGANHNKHHKDVHHQASGRNSDTILQDLDAWNRKQISLVTHDWYFLQGVFGWVLNVLMSIPKLYGLSRAYLL